MATIEKPLVEARFEHLVLDFLAYLEFERGLSRNTLEAYRGDLLQLGRFLAERDVSALDASPADVGDFLTQLAAGDADHRPSSARDDPPRNSACLRSFYRHLRREGLRESDPAATLSAPRRSRKLPQVLTRGEVDKLFVATARHRLSRVARPRAAGADVRIRTARLRGDRARDRGRGHRGTRAQGARKGVEGAGRSDRPGGAAGARRLPRARPPGAAGRRTASRTSKSSSTSGAASSRARGSTRSFAASAYDRGSGGPHEPAHAAPHLCHASAGRRLRPAFGAGDARPRGRVYDSAVHPPVRTTASGTSPHEGAPVPDGRLRPAGHRRGPGA